MSGNPFASSSNPYDRPVPQAGTQPASGGDHSLAFDPSTKSGTPATQSFMSYLRKLWIKDVGIVSKALGQIADQLRQTTERHNAVKFRVDDLEKQVEILTETLGANQYEASRSIEQRVKDFQGITTEITDTITTDDDDDPTVARKKAHANGEQVTFRSTRNRDDG